MERDIADESGEFELPIDIGFDLGNKNADQDPLTEIKKLLIEHGESEKAKLDTNIKELVDEFNAQASSALDNDEEAYRGGLEINETIITRTIENQWTSVDHLGRQLALTDFSQFLSACTEAISKENFTDALKDCFRARLTTFANTNFSPLTNFSLPATALMIRIINLIEPEATVSTYLDYLFEKPNYTLVKFIPRHEKTKQNEGRDKLELKLDIQETHIEQTKTFKNQPLTPEALAEYLFDQNHIFHYPNLFLLDDPNLSEKGKNSKNKSQCLIDIWEALKTQYQTAYDYFLELPWGKSYNQAIEKPLCEMTLEKALENLREKLTAISNTESKNVNLITPEQAKKMQFHLEQFRAYLDLYPKKEHDDILDNVKAYLRELDDSKSQKKQDEILGTVYEIHHNGTEDDTKPAGQTLRRLFEYLQQNDASTCLERICSFLGGAQETRKEDNAQWLAYTPKQFDKEASLNYRKEINTFFDNLSSPPHLQLNTARFPIRQFSDDSIEIFTKKFKIYEVIEVLLLAASSKDELISFAVRAALLNTLEKSEPRLFWDLFTRLPANHSLWLFEYLHLEEENGSPWLDYFFDNKFHVLKEFIRIIQKHVNVHARWMEMIEAHIGLWLKDFDAFVEMMSLFSEENRSHLINNAMFPWIKWRDLNESQLKTLNNLFPREKSVREKLINNTLLSGSDFRKKASTGGGESTLFSHKRKRDKDEDDDDYASHPLPDLGF